MDPQTPQRQLLSQKIDQLLLGTPGAARALIEKRMACVGCALDRFHSLENALAIYGIEAELFLRHLGQLEQDQQGEAS